MAEEDETLKAIGHMYIQIAKLLRQVDVLTDENTVLKEKLTKVRSWKKEVEESTKFSNR